MTANPVSADQEEFVLPPDTGNGGSRYDFDGECEVEITEAKASVSKKGNPMAVLTVVGLDGPAEGLQFTDYAVDFRLRNLAAAAWGDKTPRSEPLTFSLKRAVGSRVIAKFVSEEYNGKRRAKIAEYLSAKSGGGAPLPF
jgi:hypothetical protein